MMKGDIVEDFRDYANANASISAGQKAAKSPTIVESHIQRLEDVRQQIANVTVQLDKLLERNLGISVLNAPTGEKAMEDCNTIDQALFQQMSNKTDDVFARLSLLRDVAERLEERF